MEKTRPQDRLGSQRAELPIRIYLTGARSAFIGPNLIQDRYRTAVTTIIVGLAADVALRSVESVGVRETVASFLVIPPDTLCEIEAKGAIAVLFTDALRDDCSRIDLSRVGRRIAPLRASLVDGSLEASPEDFLESIFTSVGVVPRPVSRPDMARVVSEIGRHPEAFPTVEHAAEIAELSPMRFQHVFTETMGVPFRRYRQWRRMGQVIRALANGENLTQAAYAAGFSNSAHLSTAFKDMFGLRPSELLGIHVDYRLSEAEFDE